MNKIPSKLAQLVSILIAMVVVAFLSNSVVADERQLTNTVAQQQVSEDLPSDLCSCIESCVTKSSWCSKVCSSPSGECDEEGECGECYSDCEQMFSYCQLECLDQFPPCHTTCN